MKKTILLLIIFILTYLGIVAIFHWDYFKEGRVVPPSIVLSDCSEAISEISKYDWDKETAVAIMKAESKCNQNSKGDLDLSFREKDREYGFSVGLFQIRILPGREECETFEIRKNVECAYNLYLENDRSWTDWSMFNNGKYKEYLWRSLW